MYDSFETMARMTANALRKCHDHPPLYVFAMFNGAVADIVQRTLIFSVLPPTNALRWRQPRHHKLTTPYPHTTRAISGFLGNRKRELIRPSWV